MSLSFSKILVLCGMISFTGNHFTPAISKSCLSKITVGYYSVSGSDPAGLISSLREFGPRDGAGIAREARTEWSIRWGERPVACTVDIVMPTWRERAYSDPELVRKWDEHMFAVGEHEWKHAMHGIEAGDRIQNERDTDKIDSIVLQARKLDLDYDRMTGHGADEGISLQYLK